MSPRLIFSSIAMTTAMILYSIGIGSRLFMKDKTMKPWRLAVLWAGFLSDVVGTVSMTLMRLNRNGMFELNWHIALGYFAISMMGINALIGTILYSRGKTGALEKLGKLDYLMWAIWMVSYVTRATSHLL